MKPIIQLALDFLELERALKIAHEAVEAGGENIWLEAGTPLIKSEGLDAVRTLRREFPKNTIVADMKTMDVGRIEMEAAAKAGATVAHVLGAASDSTIKECIEAGKNYGIKVAVDLLEVADYVGRSRQVEAWGASHVSLHTPIDDQMIGKTPFEKVKAVAEAINIPIAVAGGLNSETAVDALLAGGSIIVVGGAITKAVDAKKATADILNALETKQKVATELFKRKGLDEIRSVLEKVSCSNISDAMHRGGVLPGLFPVLIGFDKKMFGPAVTVRTYPGDWAKPVEAIDVAQPGEVLVIESGGQTPAVWGELATNSAVVRELSGVVVNGAVRDVPEIRKLQFPTFAAAITPNAGEPKGFGEINIPIKVNGVSVFPGDWIVGDQDGVVCIPQEKLVEIANRAMDVLERENRLRGEIVNEKSTLAKVAYLLRWEKASK